MKDMKDHISSLYSKGEEGDFGEEKVEELHHLSAYLFYVAKTFTSMQ